MRKPLTTHCQDPLFAPDAPGSDASDPAALAAHLAACPACAAEAGRDASLSRLWAATRPAVPDEPAWETVWARVSAQLDRAARPESPSPSQPLTLTAPPAGRWPRHATSAFIAAQAAAILAAVALWGSHRPTPAPTIDLTAHTRAPVHAPRVDVTIEPGEVVLIHLEGDAFRAVTMGHEEQRPDTLDESTVLFNDAEAMAGMQEMIAEMHHNVHAAPPPG